jgi:hypothetical protein
MPFKPIAKKAIICSCLFITATVAALAQKKLKVDSAHVLTLRIDPSNAVGGTVSDFFTEATYVPLETTNESIFGSIAKLEITDDYYIIYDYNTHSILLFTKAGKFHAKIKSTEGSKSQIWGFTVNKFTKQIIFSRDNYKTLTYCDYDGKTVKSVKLGDETVKDEFKSSELYYFSADKGISSFYYNNLDSTSKYYTNFSKSLIIYVNDKNKVYAQGLPFTKAENELDVISSGIGPITQAGADTAFFYSKAYDNAIYTITPGGIKFSYKFIFPLYAALPADFLSNTTFNKKRIEWIEKHTQAIYSISNVYNVGDNLLFKAATYSGRNKEDNLIYNLKSGSLIAYKHIQQDAKSYMLPIYDPTGWTFESRGLLACQDGYIYTSVSSLGMFSSFEENAEQKIQYPPLLAEYFKKRNKRDNPVILLLKLKADL